jgi:hypothetical protein
LREAWNRETADPTDAAWSLAFQGIVSQKSLYQDRFILLSTGPYSAVSAETLGLSPAAWRDASRTIRLEHECAHYFTRRVFNSMRNALLDELIADYMGIVAVAGRFRADWFLQFLGLENFPAHRPGGRVENYRGTPPLSDPAIRVLASVVRSAAHNLERLDRQRGGAAVTSVDKARILLRLSRLSLEALADEITIEALWKDW